MTWIGLLFCLAYGFGNYQYGFHRGRKFEQWVRALEVKAKEGK